LGVDAERRDLVSASPGSAYLRPGELAQLASLSTSAFFLDVDGTLLDIKPRPQDVVADPTLLGLLARLSAGADGALALVSGRTIDDLDRIFAPLSLPAAGLHGAEVRQADGARSRGASAVMDAARPVLAAFAAKHPGLMLEDKGATLALHYRQRPDLAAEVLAAARTAVSAGLVVQGGKMVAELREARHNKGTAISALLATRPFAGRRAVFLGDDLTDESGFAAVNAAGGLSLRVGPLDEPSAARFRLRDPESLRGELALL
jgi:trehalose 6-phosphate phosphatase